MPTPSPLTGVRHMQAPVSSWVLSGSPLQVRVAVSFAGKFNDSSSILKPLRFRNRTDVTGLFGPLAAAVVFLTALRSAGLGLGSPFAAGVADMHDVEGVVQADGVNEMPANSNQPQQSDPKRLVGDATRPAHAGSNAPTGPAQPRRVSRQLTTSAYGLYTTACGELQVRAARPTPNPIFTFRSLSFCPAAFFEFGPSLHTNTTFIHADSMAASYAPTCCGCCCCIAQYYHCHILTLPNVSTALPLQSNFHFPKNMARVVELHV